MLPAPFRDDMTPRPAAAPVPPPSVGVWALLEGLEWVWPAAAAGPVEREEGGACERACWAGELLPWNESKELNIILPISLGCWVQGGCVCRNIDLPYAVIANRKELSSNVSTSKFQALQMNSFPCVSLSFNSRRWRRSLRLATWRLRSRWGLPDSRLC